jgi:hypothetical protein
MLHFKGAIMNHPLSGIAGWLKLYLNWSLFIFPTLITLSILGIAWQVHSQDMNIAFLNHVTFHHYFLAVLPLIICTICWRMVVSSRLYEIHIAEHIREVKFCLLAYPFAYLLLFMFFLQVEFDMGNTADYTGFWVFLFFFAEAIVWYWYFNASQRVRQTYEEINRVEPVFARIVPLSVQAKLEVYITTHFDQIKEQVLENKTLEDIYQGFFTSTEKELFPFIEFKTVCRKLYYQDNKAL